MSSPIPTRSFGGDAKDVKVGAVGHGLMGLTWTPNPTPEDECFKSMKEAADAGATFWNSGQFYNQPDQPMENLKLIAKFFKKYPEYQDKIVLSVKGGMGPKGLMGGPDSSLENLRRDLVEINGALGGKKLDLYEPARVDPKMTIEEIVKNLAILQKEGLFSHISLSEIHPDALRKAAAITPIAAVEIELSLFSLEPEAYGIIEVCKEFDIALVAYSPLGRGFLAGKFRKPEDFPEGDMRAHYPRFQGENFKTNLKLLDAVNELAEKKGITGAQIALAYIMDLYEKVIPIPGSSSSARVKENIGAANVTLTREEVDEVNNVLKEFKVEGSRYPASHSGLNWGQGKL